jgi:hypothetical protein
MGEAPCNGLDLVDSLQQATKREGGTRGLSIVVFGASAAERAAEMAPINKT